MIEVERLAARAWPAAEQLHTGGWLLRHTPGIDRRRSNSALPTGEGLRDVALVRDFYRRHSAPALVQIGPAEAYRELDAELAAGGWMLDGPTEVLVADLAAHATPAPKDRPVPIAIAPSAAAGWMAAWTACEGRSDAPEHARAVLSRIEAATAYALADGGHGLGLGVCEQGWVGLFCVATSPSARRRGVATAVVDALLRWGAGLGARRAYLQVEATNAPALALYARTGFSRSHGYHYRVAPGP